MAVAVLSGTLAEERLSAPFRGAADLCAALDEHAMAAVTDAAGKITWVNDKFCAISKYSREELMGLDPRVVNSGRHTKEFMRDLWDTIQRGDVWKGEICNRAKDGSLYWVDTTIVPFLNADGKPYQYIAILTVVTQRKAGEAEIKQLNSQLEQRVQTRTRELELANKELEAFSYSVSHDLRAPVRHIQGFIDLLSKSDGAGLSEKGRHYLHQVSSSATQMGRLIDDLLLFSRMGRSEMRHRRVNIQDVLEETIRDMVQETRDRHIIWKNSRLPDVEADPAMLGQVFAHLLSNAVKYTRPRNPAEIEIGCLDESPAEFIIYVRDNGVGFDMKYAGKLFGVFQRLHAASEFEGNGIGLANVRRVISRHGGRTWAEGRLNEGATFYFSLPKNPAEAAPGAPDGSIDLFGEPSSG